jgi:D-alanine-D-alanine ligase
VDYDWPVTSSSNRPIRLFVLFGGQSAEHDVSCTTAAHVLNAVDRSRYDIEAIGITREGQFVTAADAVALLPEAGSGVGAEPSPSAIKALEPVGAPTELMSVVGDHTTDAQVVVLPLLHGPLGEDGTIQGMCELANVPYVGAGVLGSAVAMDKAMAKTVLDAAGLPQARWRSVRESDLGIDRKAVLESVAEDLGLPCFVKPANMGSSIGVSKASTLEELNGGVDAALAYDEILVIEESVVAREIELSVLGNADLEVSVPGEVVPAAEFYDYEDKYHDGNAQLIIPAILPPGVAEELQDLARRAYRALRVEGMARADFLYEEDGRGPLVNELNTIPGFTPISMYPKLWEASGLGYSELIDRLVDLAIERHQRRAAKRNTGRTSRG